MITPTVGRVVWIRDREESLDKGQPEAALITYVHSDVCINAAGFDANGQPFARTSITLIQDDAPVAPIQDDAPVAPGGPYAHWMPYQKGQAAKTEQLEKQIGSGG